MMKLVARVVLLALAVCRTVGMADLTHEMFQARNLEELQAAEWSYHRQLGAQRQNNLKAEKLEDSRPILADMFDNQPGFYHGVASGKYL